MPNCGRYWWAPTGPHQVQKAKPGALRTNPVDMSTNPRLWTDYTFVVICAMKKERMAVEAMLDERHKTMPNRGIDENQYTFGRIGPHNIVVTSLGPGTQGNAAAARVAATFQGIRYCLVVGIAGAIPRPDTRRGDIRLGDVIVGAPTGRGQPAVVKYFLPGQTARPVAHPPASLTQCIDAMDAGYAYEGPTHLLHLADMLTNPSYNDLKSPQGSYAFPRASDVLCSVEGRTIRRPTRYGSRIMPSNLKAPFITRNMEGYHDYPTIHYGTIACTDYVVKNANVRRAIYSDILAQCGTEALCVEMEAAGVLQCWPSALVIRGICDYADSQKNKDWQNFAAASAAAYMKDLILHVAPGTVARAPTMASQLPGVNVR